MTQNTDIDGMRRGNRVRIAAWSAAALLLLLPWIAMRITDRVDWNAADFIIFGALLAGVGAGFELAVRKTGSAAYRWAAGTALAAAFLLVWVNGAVGIIGSEDNDVNRLYFGVIAVGLVGAFVARFRPRGMERALIATALAQASITVVALIAGWGGPQSGPAEILGLNGFFIALWLLSSRLFGNAAREASGPSM